MALRIKLKNSVVQDRVPTTSDLPEVGELAVNANINSIGGFMRASDNSIVKIFGPGSLSTPTATTSVPGISELATNSETTTGTATNRVVTPAGLNAVTVAERTTSNSTYLALAGGTLTGVLAATAGSNSAPAINFGDSDSGIFGGTNTVSLAAGGTTRLTADTGVDINGTLAVTGAISSTAAITGADFRSNSSATFFLTSGLDWRFRSTSGTERARIDSSGRLLVGTSSSRGVGETSEKLLQIEGVDANTGFSIVRNGANTSPPFLSFGKQRSGVVGGNTIVQQGDQLGQINFSGADGTDLVSNAASISSFVDGTPGANDMPGRLVFSTTADGASSPTTRLTIDSAGLVKLPDNGKFVAGAGNDLQISQDGTEALIRNTTGDFFIQNSAGDIALAAEDNITLKNFDGQTYARFMEDGQCELYHDDSKKLETTANGTQFDGRINFTGTGQKIDLTDNQEIRIGTGDDLQIFHNGTHSRIVDAGTGNLQIAGSLVQITNAAVTESGLVFHENGAVELYHDNSKKFETFANGVRAANNGNIKLASDTGKFFMGAGDDAQLFYDGTNLQFLGDGVNATFLRAKSDENSIKLLPNGAVELYHDNTKKFETKSFGAQVTGELYSDGLRVGDNEKIRIGENEDLQIYHDGTHSQIKDASTGELLMSGSTISLNSANSAEYMLRGIENGSIELYHDGSKKFFTNINGVTVESTGNTPTLGFRGASNLDLGKIDIDQFVSNYSIMRFSTLDNGTIRERMRILDNGSVLIGTTSQGGKGGVTFLQNASQGAALMIFDRDNTTNTSEVLRFENDNTTVGSITHNNSSTAYNTSSDYRLKENATAISDGITRLKTLKPYRFNFKIDADKTLDGFFAHEVTAVPEAVTGTKDEVDSDNNPVYQGIDQSKLVPLLVAAVQELIGKVEALEAA